ncbi:FAM151A/B family protein [Myxococcus stipitatus]|uniref:FAM151A/B family protein n=1 Tax=Myxococcus stipitatus TaxID=83455 RepID=UPI0030CC77F4
MASWLDIAFRRPPATTTPKQELQPPPQPPSPPPEVGMRKKDDFVGGSLPKGPDLTGAPMPPPLPDDLSNASPMPLPMLVPPERLPPLPPGAVSVQEPILTLDVAAQSVANKLADGGPSAASKRLANLVTDPRYPPGFADELLKAATPTLQAMANTLGERAGNGKLDDDKKDAHGKLNTTHETLKNLSTVANSVGPEGVKLLGQTLAAATPDKSELNQFDDKLAELKDEKMPGLDKLAGSLVTELEASGKGKAAKELRKEHTSLAELPPPSSPPAREWQWTPGRPLSEAHNAHSTNTRGDFNDAVKGKYNWLEGDVSMELNDTGRIEMRHDGTHEKGDNLTLTEWLNKGKELGTGLKLDVKDGAAFDHGFLEEVRAAGVPDGLLMFNYGFDEVRKQGPKTREMFPNAMIAINPPSEGTLQEKVDQMERLVASGEITQPVNFVFEYGSHPNTPEMVAQLQRLGPISIWRGNTFTGDSVENAENKLKDLGIAGMIDLKETALENPSRVVKEGIDKAVNVAVDIKEDPGKYVDKAKDKMKGAVNGVVDGLLNR